MVRRMMPVNAVVWVPGDEPEGKLKQYITDVVEDRTCDAVEVFEKERLRGLMGGYEGNITSFMYSLVGYLTTRKRPLIFSAKHGAASIASLMGEIVKANDLPPVPENDAWPKLKVTDDMEGYTNDPSLATSQVAQEPPTPDKALSLLLDVVRNMPVKDQNVAIASFLEYMRDHRAQKLRVVTQNRDFYEQEQRKAEGAVDGLNRIAMGDYFTLVVPPKSVDNG